MSDGHHRDPEELLRDRVTKVRVDPSHDERCCMNGGPGWSPHSECPGTEALYAAGMFEPGGEIFPEDPQAVLLEDCGTYERYALTQNGVVFTTCELAKPQGAGPWELECHRANRGTYLGWRLASAP